MSVDGGRVTVSQGDRLYFEDVPLDKTFVTSGRTITEADVVAFAGLSGDFNSLHVDETFAAARVNPVIPAFAAA